MELEMMTVCEAILTQKDKHGLYSLISGYYLLLYYMILQKSTDPQMLSKMDGSMWDA